MEVQGKLTVFFEDPFWVGVFERYCGGRLEVSKVVFGSEPKDYEAYEFVLGQYDRLKFSRPIAVDDGGVRKKINPKRLQRKIQSETEVRGVGTKAQLAIKHQQETNKQERRKVSKEQREEEERRKFQLRQQKKKMKHNGH